MLKEFPKFTAAAVQASPEFRDKPVYFDSLATLANAVGQIKEAAANGAKLIVFPELYIPGYCHFALDLRKGPEYTNIWSEYYRHAIEVPSEETDILCKAAREANANVVIGINERDKKYGGRMYNSILYINNLGEILGTHRKINITVQELMIHTRGDGGKNLQVYDMDFGKVSGLICGEHDQPLLKQCYIVQGTQVNHSMWPGYLGGAEELPAVIPAMTQAMARVRRLLGAREHVRTPGSDGVYRGIGSGRARRWFERGGSERPAGEGSRVGAEVAGAPEAGRVRPRYNRLGLS